jgi:hypothetical protein
MSKVLAVMIAGMFAVGAYAQNPSGMSPEQGNTNTKSQQRAEARKASKAQGQVKPAGGDTLKTPEGGAIGTDKAAVAGEARKDTRDTRKPGRAKTTQGGTPDMPGAK